MLERATRIFEAFTPENTALQLSDLARRADLPLATASRLVTELITLGLLARDGDRRICMGIKMWELALRASPTLSLRDASMPFMEDLHAVAGHHIQLGVLDGNEVLFLELLSAPDAVINITRIAGRLPLHASSAGLVLLAHAGPALLERTLSAPLHTYTTETISTAHRLRSTLSEIRRTGYVLCAGHIHVEATGIAAPIFAPAHNVVAVLAIIVPNDTEAAAQIPALRAAAAGISRSLRNSRTVADGMTDLLDQKRVSRSMGMP